MIFEQGVCKMDVDVQRTEAFYKTGGGITCTCAGCRNFAALGEKLPERIGAFLRQFGVDPAKPAEMSAVYAPDRESILYDGWYHICGTVLEGTDPEKQTGPKQWQIKEEYVLPLDGNGGTVLFQAKRDLLPTGFPEPVIQVNVMCTLPWVLDEENPY